MNMERVQSVCFEFKVISNLIRREIDNSANKQYLDSLTGTNGWVIGYLIRNDGKDIFQRDLEAEFSIRRSTASSILKRMEKNGLIRREPVDYDARLKRLLLTEKSFEVHSLIMDDITTVEKKLVRGLTEAELSAFFETADKLKRNLE